MSKLYEAETDKAILQAQTAPVVEAVVLFTKINLGGTKDAK
jgi:hypothetical protein